MPNAVRLRGLVLFVVGALLGVLAELVDGWVHKLEYGTTSDVPRTRIAMLLAIGVAVVLLRAPRGRWVPVVMLFIWGAGFTYQAAAYRSGDAAIIAALHLSGGGLMCLDSVSAWFQRRVGA